MKLGCLFLVTCLILSCDEDKKILTDTPTSGSIHVVVDETYKPIMDSEKMVFESHYPDAKIHLIYKPAMELFQEIDNDSIRLLITSVPIDSSYFEAYYKSHEYFPKTTILAKDAVALIANNQKKGLKITVPEFAKICRGEITDYSQLKHCKQSGKITLVFDNPKSSTVLYIQDSVLHGGTISAKAYAQNTNSEVLAYVQKNANALGVIGANWISDNQDEETQNFMKSIYPVEVAATDTSAYFYSPHAGYIATHLYPMRRYMNATLKEGGAGLGRGFVNFIGGDVGQRIVLKSGIVPAKAVTRVVQTSPTIY